MPELTLQLADEAASEALARSLAAAIQPRGAVIHLRGDLGAGKTTFARALLRALGWSGRVRSPTYTLVEAYDLPERRVVHADLYRLSSAREVHELGLEERDPARDWLLVEWPERGNGALPAADFELELRHAPLGRELQARAHSPWAAEVLRQTLGH